MAKKDHSPSIKDEETYEALREDGASKEKAARIANAQANSAQSSDSVSPSVRGGRAPSYEEWSKDELYERAQDIGIEGRSNMNKSELIHALRNH